MPALRESRLDAEAVVVSVEILHVETTSPSIHRMAFSRLPLCTRGGAKGLGPGQGPGALSLGALRQRRREIRQVGRRHGARNLRVVGSVARGEQQAGSDVDFLVDMEPGRTLFDVAALHDELEELLGRPVDVITSEAVRGGRLAHLADEAVPL